MPMPDGFELPFAPFRCVYVVVVDSADSGRQTPFAHIDRELVASSYCIFAIANLPANFQDLRDYRAALRIPYELMPRQAVIYVSSADWGVASSLLERYPFVAIFDCRSAASTPSLPAGHVYLRGPTASSGSVISTWTVSALESIERVRKWWPADEMDAIQDDARVLLADGPARPAKPAYDAVNQDFVRPNALIRNLSIGYWGDDAWRQTTAANIDAGDADAVRRSQIEIAQHIIADTQGLRAEGAYPAAYLVVPSINPLSSAGLRSVLRRAEGPASVVEGLLGGNGYLFQVDRDEMDERGTRVASTVFSVRSDERRFYDAIACASAAARRDLVFRSPHIPESFFGRLQGLADIEWTQATIRRTMSRWEAYCDDLTVAVGRDLVRWLSRNVRRLVTLTELPIEWCRVDGVPLGYLIPVSRIPVAPGNAPVRLLVDPSPPVHWRSVADVKILFVNAHHEDDPFGRTTAVLEQQAQRLGFPTAHETIESPEDLRSSLERHEPRILYLSTHGGAVKDIGAVLSFRSGPSPLRFDSLEHMPDVAIVSACRSERVVGTYGSPASNLFMAGVRTVLGAYLNLTEPHASMVMAGLLTNLKGALVGAISGSTWEELAWSTLNMRRPIDFLVGAQRWLSKRHRDPDAVLELFEGYVEIHNREGVPPQDCWMLVPERLARIAHGTPYETAINAVSLRHAYRPESMFYTQIGQPSRILIGPRWNLLADHL